MKMFLCVVSGAPSFTLIAMLCFTAVGCRSAQRASLLGGQCHGGACGVADHSSVNVDQTPAQMFAAMNYQEIAVDQKKEATRAEKTASLPSGPNSLFAPYR